MKMGLEPACVRNCATGALKCLDEEDYKKENMGQSLKRTTADTKER